MPVNRSPPLGGAAKQTDADINPSVAQNKKIKNYYNCESEIFLQNKISELEAICMQLKQEMLQIKADNAKLKDKNLNLKGSLSTGTLKDKIVANYETDEEELNRETDWILKKTRRPAKKRKADESLEDADQTTPTAKPTTALVMQKSIAKRPPPIMVTNVSDYQKLYSYIKDNSENEFNIKLVNNDVHKINMFDVNDYRVVTKILSDKNISWYTYENKQSRDIKVVIKNLHHSNQLSSLLKGLEAQGFKPKSAINKLAWKTKKPLDMFLVSFEPTDKIEDIFKINRILNTVVNVEPVKSSTLIPQCKNCQSYGHTKNYCGKPPKCVKCGEKHLTVYCTKLSTEKPKCSNCGEAHPANYRGCAVAKELQKLRNKSRNILNTKSHEKEPENKNLETRAQQTYATIVRSDNAPQPTENFDTSQILQNILSKLLNMEEAITNIDERLKQQEYNNGRSIQKKK